MLLLCCFCSFDFCCCGFFAFVFVPCPQSDHAARVLLRAFSFHVWLGWAARFVFLFAGRRCVSLLVFALKKLFCVVRGSNSDQPVGKRACFLVSLFCHFVILSCKEISVRVADLWLPVSAFCKPERLSHRHTSCGTAIKSSREGHSCPQGEYNLQARTISPLPRPGKLQASFQGQGNMYNDALIMITKRDIVASSCVVSFTSCDLPVACSACLCTCCQTLPVMLSGCLTPDSRVIEESLKSAGARA